MMTGDHNNHSILHRLLRSQNRTIEPIDRFIIATLIVGATITMIFIQVPIPDAWWAMATAVTSYLFQPRQNAVEARRHAPTSPNSTN